MKQFNAFNNNFEIKLWKKSKFADDCIDLFDGKVKVKI